MQQNSNENGNPLKEVTWLIGNSASVAQGQTEAACEPFNVKILDFLNEVSRELMASREAKQYPDIVTFAFWIRRSSTQKLKKQFYRDDGNIHLGRGLVFHIAPSNVPVNFAYSLAVGLLTGNLNVVRVPSKAFPQIGIIERAFSDVLDREEYRSLKSYISLVRYDRNREVNDYFSAIADTRIIWGGDSTVEEIRKSPLAPRAGEITFADRYSIAVIDADTYMDIPDKMRIAKDFYNDTFLSDQNACTSPRLVAWLGDQRDEAKTEFWGNLHKLVEKEYVYQPIMGVNKLSSSCLTAVKYAKEGLAVQREDKRFIADYPFSDDMRRGVVFQQHEDNLIFRIQVPRIIKDLMDLKDNSGYFFEYDCDDILELKSLCDDKHCQTLAYLGRKEIFTNLLQSGIHGVDRVVPIGKTMDFDLIWDGYNLYERLTRIISVNR